MPHSVSLITTIAAGLGLALALGLIASRLRIPPLVAQRVSLRSTTLRTLRLS